MGYTKVGETKTIPLNKLKEFKSQAEKAGIAVIGDPIGLPSLMASLPLGTIVQAYLADATVQIITLADADKKIVLPLLSFTSEFGDFKAPVPSNVVEQLNDNAKLPVNFVITTRKDRPAVEYTAKSTTVAPKEQEQVQEDLLKGIGS